MVYDRDEANTQRDQQWLYQLLGVDFFLNVRSVHFEFRLDNAKALEHLPARKKLEQLHLNASKVTDNDLVYLKGLHQLRELYLSKTPITDAGLVHLQNLKNLQTLNLSETKITDAGLIHLKEMTRLEYLFLLQTQINGTGFKHLHNLDSTSTFGSRLPLKSPILECKNSRRLLSSLN